MQLEVIDKHGNVRRLRPGESLADGERLRVPHTFMDANALAARDALAQRHGQHAVTDRRPRGYVRGFQTLATLLPTRDSCDEATKAYEAKRSRLDSARRNISDGTPALDAKQAYDERSSRLQNAWRKDYRDDADAAPQSTQDARAVADRAYEDRKARLSNAWRR
jgi:hypothetical protein